MDFDAPAATQAAVDHVGLGDDAEDGHTSVELFPAHDSSSPDPDEWDWGDDEEDDADELIEVPELVPASHLPASPTELPTRNTFANNARTRSSREARDKICRNVELGMSVQDAVADAGMSMKSHAYYRKTDPGYAGRIDLARALQGKKAKRGWTGDSSSFAEEFFPKEFPNPAFHHDIRRRIQNAKPGTITLISCFPNSGKSAIIEDLICETLAVDPNHRFVIASKAQNHARKILDTVKDRMTNIAAFSKFIGRFGPFYVDGMDRQGRPWTRDYIKVYKNDGSQRDMSVQVMGWSGQILGSRVDTIILDDIQTGDNMSSVEDMLRKFRQEYYTRLKGGRIIIIGNRIDNGDFYERLIDLDIIESANHFDFPAVDIDGNSLWPERWPKPELDTMRRVVGEKIWWTTYQQKPMLATNATFDDDMIDRSKDWTFKVGTVIPGMATVLSVDPGMDPGVTAITALQYDANQIRLVDAEQHNDFTQQEQIIDLIESYALRYSPQHVVIEAVHWQRALERDERLQELGRRYGFLTHPHVTNRNKLDPMFGVAAMASSFIRDEIRVPWGNDNSIARMEPLLAELRSWRPNIPTKLLKQDYPMSLWFGWLFILNQRHAMGVGINAWSRPSLPWQRTSTQRILTPRLKAV